VKAATVNVDDDTKPCVVASVSRNMVDLKDTLGIVIATLGGAAIGLEREWSGHAVARFAGIRTFTLIGLAAGIAGWLWLNGQHWLALTILGSFAALIVAAYVAAARVAVDGTTEVAALVVLTAGAVSGMHEVRLASAVFAVTTLLLVEKSWLHGLVRRIEDESLRAAVRFTVMALVILPLLPVGPYGPLGGVRPRQLWALVLFFSGLSFAGYLSRRFVGPNRGYPIAGLLGGIISSTNVTLSFARTSRTEPDAGGPLATGVMAASAVMCIRVLVATAVLNPAASRPLIGYLLAPFLASAVIAWAGIHKYRQPESHETPPSNPLQFTSALQMAVLFQIVLFAVRWAQSTWGQAGLFVSAAIFGLTDMDALVISMSKGAVPQLAPTTVALAIMIGVLSNTILKLSIGVAVGERRFRRIVAVGLSLVAVACALVIAPVIR
jgi:uncharacterized membrane protein (DUF4010 family)